jgi:hypothetical protein
MNVKNLVWGFAPLALFSLATPLVGPGAGALLGVAAALAVVLTGAHHGVKTLPVVTAVVLAVIGGVALVGDAGTDRFLTDYGRGIAGLVLGAYMLVTARPAPFTAQFARQAVPERFWHEPAFRRVNTHISAAWGCVVAVASAAHLAAADLPDGQPGGRLLTWGVLAVAGLIALRYTRDQVQQVTPATVH